MKVLLIDTESLFPQIIETEGGLSEWYRLLKCDLIDITKRKVGGRYFDIIADDEGLLKAGAKVSALDSSQRPQLVGNLIFCNHDGEGNETSLTDDDIAHLLQYVVILTEDKAEEPQRWVAIYGVDF